MGDHRFQDSTSAHDAVVHHGAAEWHRLDREEQAERRQRGLERRSAALKRGSRNGRTRTEVKVWPEVLRAALRAADGDASRLRIVSDTEVWVV